MRGTGGKAVRCRVGVAAGLVLLLLTLAACGSPGPATSRASASPSANSAGNYLGCLLQHSGGSQDSARKACTSLRPADLGAVLQTFENCLKAHGVSVPSRPAQGRRAALVQFVAGLHAGSPSQRTALASCGPSGNPG